MKHETFSTDHLRIGCPDLILNAVLLQRLSALSDFLGGENISFHCTSSGAKNDLVITYEKCEIDGFDQEFIGNLTFQPYFPKSGCNGWIAANSDTAETPVFQLEQRAFSQPPAFMMPSLPARIAAMKTTGMAAVLPDIIAGLDADLDTQNDPSLIEGCELWLHINQRRSKHSGVQITADWIKACAHEMFWLNAPIEKQQSALKTPA